MKRFFKNAHGRVLPVLLLLIFPVLLTAADAGHLAKLYKGERA